ncbi:MAG: HlyD family secretion protein [Planctomycetota bacterium]
MRGRIVRIAVFIVVAAGIAVWAVSEWRRAAKAEVPAGFVTGNGRIEATEIGIATKAAGRVEEILVDEGDLVEAGEPLARMQTDALAAQRAEAVALLQQARQGVATARAQVAVRESALAAAQALAAQRENELDLARRRLDRAETAGAGGATSPQELDDARTQRLVAERALEAARSQCAAAQAAIEAARAETYGAEATVSAREAIVARIDTDLADCVLSSPRAGRVQYRVAEPREVLPAGGRVLNVIDLSDAYMTFFLPETVAGRIALGTEVRIVLDAAPGRVIPATVSFIASTAQFTPKTVETREEREKLMFRVRARIAPELLERHRDQVKSGVPGVAWIRVDEGAPWPAALSLENPG